MRTSHKPRPGFRAIPSPSNLVSAIVPGLYSLEAVVVEADDTISPAQLQHSLRSLARMIVRAHHAPGDGVPNVIPRPPALTLVPHPSPDHGDG